MSTAEPSADPTIIRLRTIVETVHVIMQSNHSSDAIEGNGLDQIVWIAGMLDVPPLFVSMIAADFSLPEHEGEVGSNRVKAFLEWASAIGTETIFEVLKEGREALDARYEKQSPDPEWD